MAVEEAMGINETLKALADPTRRGILELLRDGDMTAGQIAERFDLAKSTLSGHFNVLKSTGLIVSERSRNTIVYSINMSAFDDAAAALMSFFESHRHPNGRSDARPETSSTEDRDD
jgi:ArsR family transcriptional regulator, arsenate/arsenite/antimonite-responsive transcriptional repressor